MPSIYGLGGATVRSAPPEWNATTYYDTPDLRLARWGASLRHRPGEGWTVKLPAERDAPFLVRPEIVFAGNGGQPPDAAVELVRGFVRDEPLAPSVQMTTIRRRTGLHDADGRLIGGVVDDAVSVLDGRAPTSFRELEVEIGEEMTPTLLDALVERLRQAGAGAPDQTAKYIRALTAHTPLAPEVPVSDLAHDATAGEVVRHAIALSAIRLILHDPVVRLDVDPEGVHQARVATRRLRSDLRTFRSLLASDFASSLRDELGWLAASPGGGSRRGRAPRTSSCSFGRASGRRASGRRPGALCPGERARRSARAARRGPHEQALRHAPRHARRGGQRSRASTGRRRARGRGRPEPSFADHGTSSRSASGGWATTRPTRNCTRSGSGRSASATRPTRSCRSSASRHAASPAPPRGCREPSATSTTRSSRRRGWTPGGSARMTPSESVRPRRWQVWNARTRLVSARPGKRPGRRSPPPSFAPGCDRDGACRGRARLPIPRGRHGRDPARPSPGVRRLVVPEGKARAGRDRRGGGRSRGRGGDRIALRARTASSPRRATGTPAVAPRPFATGR